MAQTTSRFHQFYSLTKPGVMFGNVLTAAAGFLLAAGQGKNYDFRMFIALLVGTTLVIAAACVLNNYLDQDIDRLMKRTKNRALAHGDLPPRQALIFSMVLAAIGFAVLLSWLNGLVVAIGAIGFITYVWLYGALSKRRSVHGTLVGSISGALPILAGYCAVSGRIDGAAILVFLMLFCWQFPEFYSIAIYRRNEYKAANIPVMPLVVGVWGTRLQIAWYTLAFVVASLLLTPLGYTGWLYFTVMGLLGMYWLYLAARGLPRRLTQAEGDAWAHKVFHFSLIILLVLSVMLAIGPLIP